MKNFFVSEKEIQALKTYMSLKKEIKTELNGKENGLQTLLKAMIGRNLYDRDAYYPVLNGDDAAILKAIEALK